MKKKLIFLKKNPSNISDYEKIKISMNILDCRKLLHNHYCMRHDLKKTSA